MSSPGHASLKIYDASGRLVRTLLDDEKGSGLNSPISVFWDLRDERVRRVTGGVYFYRVTALGSKHYGKMVLLR